MRRLVVVVLLLSAFVLSSAEVFAGDSIIRRLKSPDTGLCAHLIEPAGYPCSEHIAQTKDGYLLGLQRVWGKSSIISGRRGSPVLLLHGLMMSGDAWFLDSPSQSLGFILADHGFDVWAGNVRGTRWSHGHISFQREIRGKTSYRKPTSQHGHFLQKPLMTHKSTCNPQEFWDWSFQELALYDLAEMARYIYSLTNSKVFVVGHSQGTIMSLAAFTQPDIVAMIEAAALLSPISYLDHITSKFVLRLVSMHFDQAILAMGIHELNFKSDFGTHIMDMMCDGHLNCEDFLSSITVIRKGTFKMYDYGFWKNMKLYGWTKPPKFDLTNIPKSLPLWMAYGGNDALADVTDVRHTLKELQSKPELVYLENYGHIDFLLSVRSKEDLYDNMIQFFKSCKGVSSFKYLLMQVCDIYGRMCTWEVIVHKV